MGIRTIGLDSSPFLPEGPPPVITPPRTPREQLADLIFRHGNLVRELWEEQQAIARVREQIPLLVPEKRHEGYAVVARLTTEHARLDSALARISEQLRCQLSVPSAG